MQDSYSIQLSQDMVNQLDETTAETALKAVFVAWPGQSEREGH